MRNLLRKFIGLFSMRPPYAFADRIRVSGRDTFDYFEGGRTVTIYVELLVGKIERRIYPSSINRWSSPNGLEEITPAERFLILQSLCEYFKWHGIQYEIGEEKGATRGGGVSP